jgi:hypothetical protein
VFWRRCWKENARGWVDACVQSSKETRREGTKHGREATSAKHKETLELALYVQRDSNKDRVQILD